MSLPMRFLIETQVVVIKWRHKPCDSFVEARGTRVSFNPPANFLVYNGSLFAMVFIALIRLIG